MWECLGLQTESFMALNYNHLNVHISRAVGIYMLAS